MSLVDISAYFALLVSITLAPGPLMAILVARSLAGDIRGAAHFGLGIAAGDVIVMALVCAGLGLWLQSFPQVFTAAKIAGVAYVIWIAINMWKGEDAGNASASPKTGALAAFAGGIATCIMSPQTILLYLLLLPRLVDVTNVSAGQFSLVAMVTLVALAATFMIVILLAGKFRQILNMSSASMTMNRVLAVVVGGSGLWIIAA